MLHNASFPAGATWAPTGGTATVLVQDGRETVNGLSLVVSGDTNLLTRRTMIARATLPGMPAAVGAYAKLSRNELVYTIPFVAADGKLYKQTIRIAASFHAEYSGKNAAIGDIAAFVSDADFTDFWQKSLVV